MYSLEAPEEEYDPRSLFERLQEQKDKKQEEYEEQFKFSESGFFLENTFPSAPPASAMFSKDQQSL